ncbi:hypothetical protein GCT13_25005 [Paraburkholderia sp. CNPSo 3157]|uniref:Uncharacterized protein n=1 Tax=Paraburkholderia franconis TaxID=2654983 RepID=A0A7X1NEI0_9BURK|nr:hypothetical protein [Paraburkholderia franconis]MPW20061.1 hypothetical protein [Paraburkholderia franconis]
MKKLIYERDVAADTDRVGVRLYQVDHGFVAERFLVQYDQMTLVQILPVASRNDFEGFARADPHHAVMRPVYQEVRTIVWKNEDGVGITAELDPWI